MNRGLEFSSLRKMALTVLNIFCTCIGIILVCRLSPPLAWLQFTDIFSAVLVYTPPARQSTTTPRVPAFHVPTTHIEDTLVFSDRMTAYIALGLYWIILYGLSMPTGTPLLARSIIDTFDCIEYGDFCQSKSSLQSRSDLLS
jgi:hypothetical protein